MRLSSRFALDILVVIGGAFLAVAAMSFGASMAGWVAFGVSTGLAVFALGDLTANEIREESVVHRLEVTHATVGSAN